MKNQRTEENIIAPTLKQPTSLLQLKNVEEK